MSTKLITIIAMFVVSVVTAQTQFDQGMKKALQTWKEGNSKEALSSAIRIMKESGGHAVKLEGGQEILESISRILTAGIPVMGHLGLTPQSVHALGGFKVQGRGEEGQVIINDAKALEAAGVFAIVLEAVPADLAGEIRKQLSIPT